MCVCVCVKIVFTEGVKRETFLKWSGPRRDLYSFKIYLFRSYICVCFQLVALWRKKRAGNIHTYVRTKKKSQKNINLFVELLFLIYIYIYIYIQQIKIWDTHRFSFKSKKNMQLWIYTRKRRMHKNTNKTKINNKRRIIQPTNSVTKTLNDTLLTSDTNY